MDRWLEARDCASLSGLPEPQLSAVLCGTAYFFDWNMASDGGAGMAGVAIDGFRFGGWVRGRGCRPDSVFGRSGVD